MPKSHSAASGKQQRRKLSHREEALCREAHQLIDEIFERGWDQHHAEVFEMLLPIMDGVRDVEENERTWRIGCFARGPFAQWLRYVESDRSGPPVVGPVKTSLIDSADKTRAIEQSGDSDARAAG